MPGELVDVVLPASLIEIDKTCEKSKRRESNLVEATYMDEQVVMQRLGNYGWFMDE